MIKLHVAAFFSPFHVNSGCSLMVSEGQFLEGSFLGQLFPGLITIFTSQLI